MLVRVASIKWNVTETYKSRGYWSWQPSGTCQSSTPVQPQACICHNISKYLLLLSSEPETLNFYWSLENLLSTCNQLSYPWREAGKCDDTHHHAQPWLGISREIMKKNKEFLPTEVERDQLIGLRETGCALN